MRERLVWLLLLLSPLSVPLSGADSALAPVPPIGWNSWDSYGMTVKESEFKANAAWMAQHLKQYGWQYAVVDEGWYLENPEAKPGGFRFVLDETGRYTPAVNRFPSAANGAGFKNLAGEMHALGLKFGIHIIRGIPKEAVAKNLPVAGSSYRATDAADQADTCPWNKDNYGVKDNPAGQAYYDSIAQLYAGWGIDFIKVDCIASHPYKAAEIRMISEALRKTGRPIVLSLSPGPAPLDKAEELAAHAQMWRISDDFWDHWKPSPKQEWSQSLVGQFANTAKWAPYVGPDHWPDADMLPVGTLGPRPGNGAARQTAFTHDEQQTLLTLWCIFRSPLMMGGNLTANHSWTTSLLTNREVLAVNQQSTGNRQLLARNDEVIWLAQPESKSGYYLALFNIGDNAQTFQHSWQELGLQSKQYKLRSLWDHKDLSIKGSLRVTLQPHASALYLIHAAE